LEKPREQQAKAGKVPGLSKYSESDAINFKALVGKAHDTNKGGAKLGVE
jgi:hypothetical protein